MRQEHGHKTQQQLSPLHEHIRCEWQDVVHRMIHQFATHAAIVGIENLNVVRNLWNEVERSDNSQAMRCRTILS